MSDHVGVDEALTTPRLAATRVVASKTVGDIYHCNSIDVAASGSVLVSARDTNALFMIDKSTGTIRWKFGGTPTNLDDAQIILPVGDTGGPFSGQHDARVRPNGDISLYDDHSGGTGPARGVEYAFDLGAGTASPVWQYAAPDGVPASATGSFRRSADGNENVVGWGFRPGSGFTETDAAGAVRTTLTFPDGDLVYRVVKQPPGALDVNLLRETAGPGPSSTDWEDLGGGVVEAPAAASWSAGRLDVFAGHRQPVVASLFRWCWLGCVGAVGWGVDVGSGGGVVVGGSSRRVRGGAPTTGYGTSGSTAALGAPGNPRAPRPPGVPARPLGPGKDRRLHPQPRRRSRPPLVRRRLGSLSGRPGPLRRDRSGRAVTDALTAEIERPRVDEAFMVKLREAHPDAAGRTLDRLTD